MKKTIIYLATAILLAFGGAFMNIVKADNPVNPHEAYIRSFYAEYKKALDEEYKQIIENGIISDSKSLSVIKKYCTENFYNDMKRQQESDNYDLVTDNLGMDKNSLSTMKVFYVNDYCSKITYKTSIEDPITKKVDTYTVRLEIIFVEDKIKDIHIPHDE